MGAKAELYQINGGEYVLQPGDILPAALVGKVFPAFPLRLPHPPCGSREPIPTHPAKNSNQWKERK